MEGLDYWRLCEELTIVQAALLIVGENPAGAQGSVEQQQLEERPDGYEAVKTALSTALMKGTISGTFDPHFNYDVISEMTMHEPDSIDIDTASVEVASLRRWLAASGIHSDFFVPMENSSPDYLNPQNSCYAPKLAAAINAWQAVTTDPKYLDNGKHVKQNLESWLTAHAAEFDLVKNDGAVNTDAIKNQISKVANWKEKGGAPKTPGQ
jgi:hypothetical protein